MEADQVHLFRCHTCLNVYHIDYMSLLNLCDSCRHKSAKGDYIDVDVKYVSKMYWRLVARPIAKVKKG